MSVKNLTTSFVGGEITPELFGRLDLPNFQSGLATCRNCIVLPHGPVTARPGFEYVLEVKDSTKKTRIIDFAFNTQQTYAVEIGDQYMRFHTNGATVLEAAQNITALTQANPGVFTIAAHGYSNGHWLYINSLVGPTDLNARFFIVAGATTNTFTLTDLAGNAIDTSALAAYVSGGTASKVYEITTPYLEADLFDIHFVQSADVMTLTHPNYAVRELTRLTASTFQLSTVTFAPTIAAPTGVTATATTGSGSTTYEYVVTAIASDGLEQSIASASANCTNDLTTAGNFNTVAWSTVAGAVRYDVYKLDNGLYGYIGQTADLSFIDDNIAADVTVTPPEASDPFNSAGNYPSTVSYFEQRRIFANTDNGPQNLWLTRSGTESNMTYSIPTQDDDAINVKIAARQVNEIRHVVPVNDLLLLTSGAAWRTATPNGGALSPINIAIRPQPSTGASNVQPVISSGAILYVQDRGSRMQEIKYQWQSNGYAARDISIAAPHLFDDYTITDMTFTQVPLPIAWVVRSDGTLLGLTYLPDASVLAWHKHDTAGTFESVTSVAEGSEDRVYAVVARTVNGRSVRYVERLHTRRFDTLADWFGVDAGLTYSGAAATTITGLHHLEGETVSILADGAVEPQQTVTNGTITLNNAAAKVHVGLPMINDIELLPVMSQAQAALGQGTVKNVNQAFLRVYRSSGIYMGPSASQLRQFKQRTTEPYGSPPNLVTDEIIITLDAHWSNSAQQLIRQSDPLPLTLLSLTMEVEYGS